MAAKKGLLGLGDRETRRPPLVGMQFLHRTAVRLPKLPGPHTRLHAKDLIGVLVRHFAGPRKPAPARRRIRLHVLTPAGVPAVKVRLR